MSNLEVSFVCLFPDNLDNDNLGLRDKSSLSLSLSRLARSGLAWNNRNLVNSEEKRVVKTEERERLKETGGQ